MSESPLVFVSEHLFISLNVLWIRSQMQTSVFNAHSNIFTLGLMLWQAELQVTFLRDRVLPDEIKWY